MISKRWLKFLILLVLNVWPREKIAFRTSTQNIQSATSVLLGRSHVVVLGQQLPTSAVPISRINTEGVVKRIRRTSDSPPDLDAEGSDEFDGDKVEVVDDPVGQQSSTSPSQPPAKRFQIGLISSTSRNFQPTLSAIPTSLPHSSPSSSHTRPAINPAGRPSPFNSPEPHKYSPLNNSNLRPSPVEEEQSFHLYCFLLPKYFTKEIIGLSKLPEKIQI
ncbi:hypothetical protein O181_123819 [Austropuccinia psidii MF-1]|uniref:Uncharacterized protein n=1 Tax=Austropuccinia psidii MF-1 TaxID=1389203 RepID=A0A9Q3Q3M2_9BASI|nr:hypothetical protein [Austropuccinia psidii MF-1]